MAQPQTEVPKVPTREQLEAQLTQLIVTRSQLKDQLDAIERQLPTVSALVQLLTAQEATFEAAAKEAKAPKI